VSLSGSGCRGAGDLRHPGVVTCNLYVPDAGAPSGLIARKLIASMTRPAARYLQPDQRDFIAIALRSDPR
jgi:hypothetical protein